MKTAVWYMKLLACWAVLVVVGNPVATSEQAGIRLEVPETAHPGDVITVKAFPDAPMNSGNLEVFVVSPSADSDEVSSQLPHEFSFTIRKDAIGLVKFSAMAIDEIHDLTYTTEADVRVVTDATLEAFELQPVMSVGQGIPGLAGLKALMEEQHHRQQIKLVVGQEQGIHIIGTYSDSVKRPLESPRTGTTYHIEHPEVVRVTDDGILEAVREGVTEVVASQGKFSVTLNVQVFSDEAKLLNAQESVPIPQEAQPKREQQSSEEVRTVINKVGIINERER